MAVCGPLPWWFQRSKGKKPKDSPSGIRGTSPSSMVRVNKLAPQVHSVTLMCYFSGHAGVRALSTEGNSPDFGRQGGR